MTRTSTDTRTEEGRRRIDWARAHMPILAGLHARFSAEKPFQGLTIGICLHVEAKTAVWVDALTAGGARIVLTGSPGTTQDEVAHVLNQWRGVTALGHRAESFDDHLSQCANVLEAKPDLIADNGGDLHALLTRPAFAALRDRLLGATEETTTGGNRLREELPDFDFATWVINDTRAKRVVENRYGVGSSVVDGLMRATNLMLHGKRVVVIGYGFCGSGVAQRLRGMGAHVTVVEPDPLTRLEAHLEGFTTRDLPQALPCADLVITVTGRDGVLGAEMQRLLPDGCLLANAGHFSSEIDATALSAKTMSRRPVRDHVEELTLSDGRRLYLLAGGNPVNLAAGDGNPVEIMDLGLALQSLSLEQIARQGRTLPAGVHPVRADVEAEVARLTVAAWIGPEDTRETAQEPKGA
ncbi:adenosylhomocysteinase [Pseudooceanicola sp. 200-1SW]|uniref:adenosylhomocysteinase n=1 Tax=Pseudooceanicola sp. 200-1SW TaxID=3425949 RepID=UPI003D7F7825